MPSYPPTGPWFAEKRRRGLPTSITLISSSVTPSLRNRSLNPCRMPLWSVGGLRGIAAEVAQDVLVGERHAELFDPDWPVHRHDPAAPNADTSETRLAHSSSSSNLPAGVLRTIRSSRVRNRVSLAAPVSLAGSLRLRGSAYPPSAC